MSTAKHIVRVLAVAEDDLSEIITYIAGENLIAAEKLLSRFEKALDLLSRNAHLGRIPKETELIQLGYRFVVTENYLIFYVVEGKTVYVHRVIHGARDYASVL